jgi:hypothetical protein
MAKEFNVQLVETRLPYKSRSLVGLKNYETNIAIFLLGYNIKMSKFKFNVV